MGSSVGQGAVRKGEANSVEVSAAGKDLARSAEVLEAPEAPEATEAAEGQEAMEATVECTPRSVADRLGSRTAEAGRTSLLGTNRTAPDPQRHRCGNPCSRDGRTLGPAPVPSFEAGAPAGRLLPDHKVGYSITCACAGLPGLHVTKFGERVLVCAERRVDPAGGLGTVNLRLFMRTLSAPCPCTFGHPRVGTPTARAVSHLVPT